MCRGYFREGNASMQTKMGTSTLSSTPHLKQDLKACQHHSKQHKTVQNILRSRLPLNRKSPINRAEMYTKARNLVKCQVANLVKTHS